MSKMPKTAVADTAAQSENPTAADTESDSQVADDADTAAQNTAADADTAGSDNSTAVPCSAWSPSYNPVLNNLVAFPCLLWSVAEPAVSESPVPDNPIAVTNPAGRNLTAVEAVPSWSKADSLVAGCFNLLGLNPFADSNDSDQHDLDNPGRHSFRRRLVLNPVTGSFDEKSHSDSDEHVSPSVSGSDDAMSDVIEFPGLKVSNQRNTVTTSKAVDAASKKAKAGIDLTSKNDSVILSQVVNVELSDANGSKTARKVVINTAVTLKKSKNRKLPCFFCGQFVFHMSRHLSRKHSEEPLVAAALAKTTGKELALQRIHNSGIYKHNVEVLRNSDGVLIVGRAPAKQHGVDDFLPCQFCLQFYVKHELYRHCRECKFREASASMDSPQNSWPFAVAWFTG